MVHLDAEELINNTIIAELYTLSLFTIYKYFACIVAITFYILLQLFPLLK